MKIKKINHAHKPVKVRFCPECKSTNVKFVFYLKNLFGLVPRIECLDCGNHAVDFPLIILPTKKRIKKTTKKKTLTSKKAASVRGKK